MKTIQIREYGTFVVGEKNGNNVNGNITLTKRTFEQLETFILSNSSKETDALELMGLSARRGVGKIITARNYVGIITMNDGTTIEILPKVYSAIEDDERGSRTKKLLLDMLKTLRDTPFKSLQTSNVNVEKMNVFEIFIRMFVDEVFFIVKRGLKCNYETIEENATFFRGKMKFSQQIRYNYVHKERSYVVYDAFTVNRPENRLLKAALQYLYRHSTSSKNRNDLKLLLNAFGEVEASPDYKGDFAKYTPDRHTRDYATALLWAKVFLMGKSFTSFAGSEVALALLFPMESLFESYIATLLRRSLDASVFTVSAQDRSYHLFEEPKAVFQMKPDIVITTNDGKNIFIMDTKWKVLSDEKSNYGISQADMYQMFAYQKKYGGKNVTLLYPKTDQVQKENIEFRESHDGGVTVRVRFVGLFEVQNSLNNLQDEFLSMSPETVAI
jgi:5-methylcytosine-specific restriction enzyme subunit McrC